VTRADHPALAATTRAETRALTTLAASSPDARGAALLRELAALAPEARDAAVEGALGLGGPPPDCAPPGADLIGYHASGVGPIALALTAAEVGPGHVLIDLGSGLGKVVLLARLFTGARARGVELQATLVDRARATACALGAEVTFVHADARDVDLDDGDVFFLYAPFTGAVLATVLGRLRAVGARRRIVVCALGLDLHHLAPWLTAREAPSFWLTVYESAPLGA